MVPDSCPADSPEPCAVVLAAGLGRRMGGCAKPALRVGGFSVLEHLVTAFRGAGVQHVSVVLGPYRDVLLPLALRCGAVPVMHTLANPELVHSQRLALQAHASQHAGRDVMLVLGDLPLLRAAHLQPLLAAWHGRAANVHALVPVVEGTQGHPVMLSWTAVGAICAQPPDMGVRHWMASHAAHSWRLPCHDSAHVTDLDSPDDLERLRQLVHPDLVDWS